MPATEEMTLKVNVETNIRVKHVVLRTASNFYDVNLRHACADMDSEQMTLLRVVDAGASYAVLVFVGVEHAKGVGDDGEPADPA